MTEEREFYATTVDEAVGKAADELGLPAEEISYTVLDEGNSGFLGIGARDARILVRPRYPLRRTAIEEDEPLAAVPDDEATDSRRSKSRPKSSRARKRRPLPRSTANRRAPNRPKPRRSCSTRSRVLVTSILDAMDFDAGVEVYDAGGFIAVDVASEDTALFIGQKGETIDALQYLVNVAAFKERDFFKRIVLDAEGYRQRRVEAIQGMAHRTARKALRERRTVEMPPMNSSERRVVHLYLSENPNVTTESEGTGDGRRVMVSPS